MYSHNGRKLNILFVFGGEKAQGAEIVIERMMSFIAERYNLHLILSPGEFADKLISTGKPYKITTLADLKKLNRAGSNKITFYTKAVINYFTIPKAINKYIKNHNIDVVHTNTLVPAAYLLPLAAAKKAIGNNVKWMWSDHDMAYFSKAEDTLALLCLNVYDRTLLVSAALKKKYKDNSQKISVFYNGLDPQHFKADALQRASFRSKWHIEEDQVVLAIAGSINPDKGQLELVTIFSRLKENYKNIKLIIAGNYAAQFPEYVIKAKQAISLQSDIIYIGFTTDTAELYNGCDIIINNSNHSRSESLGTTIYEAMSCEKIVIASRTGGTPEIITDEIEGFLFVPEDSDDLHGKLQYVLDNFAGLTIVRRKAREKVLKRFNIEIMASDYQEILVDLIKN